MTENGPGSVLGLLWSLRRGKAPRHVLLYAVYWGATTFTFKCWGPTTFTHTFTPQLLQRSCWSLSLSAKYELWNNIKQWCWSQRMSSLHQQWRGTSKFSHRSCSPLSLFAKNDSGVKVKQCHDVDCNFAKEGVCNNEDEHQKQWNEAEKATEEVLVITNNVLFIFWWFLTNVDCWTLFLCSEPILSVVSLFWTKYWSFQKVRRRIRRKFDKEEEKLEGGAERRKRGQKDGKKGRERDFRVSKWIYKQWAKSSQPESAHERWDIIPQLYYLFVIITYKHDQNQAVGLSN